MPNRIVLINIPIWCASFHALYADCNQNIWDIRLNMSQYSGSLSDMRSIPQIVKKIRPIWLMLFLVKKFLIFKIDISYEFYEIGYMPLFIAIWYLFLTKSNSSISSIHDKITAKNCTHYLDILDCISWNMDIIPSRNVGTKKSSYFF